MHIYLFYFIYNLIKSYSKTQSRCTRSLYMRSPITSNIRSKPIMIPQALTSNSYINIESEDNFIRVNNLHHVVIKTNLVHIKKIPHHIYSYRALHDKKQTNTTKSCIRNIHIDTSIKHLPRTFFKSHLCIGQVNSHTHNYTKQLPLSYPRQDLYFTSIVRFTLGKLYP